MSMSVTNTGAPGSEADTIDLSDLFGVLWRRKWLIMAVAALGTAAAAGVGMRITPEYTATAALMIEPQQSNVVNFQTVIQGLTGDQATLATQVNLLASRDQIERVMDDMRLFEDPEFNPALRGDPSDLLPIKVVGPFDKLLAWLPDRWLIATGLAEERQPVLESEAPTLSREAAIDNFKKKLSVSTVDPSYVITIAFTSQDAQKAAAVANRAAEIYVQQQLDAKRGAAGEASGWLGARLEELRAEVEAAEAAVEAYRAQNNLLSAGGSGLSEQQLGDVNRQLIDAKAELAEKQAKLKLVREMRARNRGFDAIAEVLSSPVIISLRDQETQLLRQEADLRATYGDRHPRIQQLRTEKAQIYAKISAEIARIGTSLENDVEIVQARVDALESQLGGAKTATARDNDSLVRLRELERQAQASRTLYETFLQRFKEAKGQDEIIRSDARIISLAAPPVRPSTPGPRLFGAVGLAASLFLGSILALLLERGDKGLRSARQLERVLGAQPLALVPRLDRLKRKQKPHQYMMAKPLSIFTEAVRAIYTNLKLAAAAQPGLGYVVMVTSALPQEGKTTLTVSLASLIARSQKRVLLIDLDLRHPSIHREIGRPVTAGLVEYMVGDRTLEEVIHHDPTSGLDYLPIKRQTANPTEVLDSDRMRQLIEACRQSYDFIVLDSAPVLSVTDSKVAARLADGALFLVRWAETHEEAASLAFQQLRDTGVAVRGIVLTQVDLKKHAQYGYGDMGQYYSKYSDYYVN